MTEASSQAQRLIEAHRRQRALTSEAHARVWGQLEASIAAGKRLDLPAQEDARRPTGSRLSPRVLVVGAVAIAAMLVAAFRLAGMTASPEGSAVPSAPPQAAYEADRRDQAGVLRPRSQAPAESTGAQAAALGPDSAEPKGAKRRTVTPSREPATEERREVRAPPHDVASPQESATTSALRAEMELLRRARDALEADRPREALEVLEQHVRAYPEGQMVEDRMALRIRALCAVGKGPQARGEAQVFLRRHPRSPHADQIRKTCRLKGGR